MNRKQRIIISVTGIILVTLILLGLTYAYFLTKINGNTNDKSISVALANLEIKYDDNKDVITGDKIEPGTILPEKIFTVTNTGDANVGSYSVGFIDVLNTFKRTEDVIYTITCSSSITNKKCNGVENNEFPILNSYIVSNQINKDEVQTYTINVTYKNLDIDQSIDMNKELSAKIDIFNSSDLSIEGNITNVSENDYVVIQSKEQKSEIVDGKYRFIGIEADNHKIILKNRDNSTTKEASLVVNRASTAIFSDTSIDFTNIINEATVNVVVNDNDLTLMVNNINDGSPSALKDKILYFAKKGGVNKTLLGSNIKSFTGISNIDERVLNITPDDYGDSYYYRGNVLDNYVNFAGFLWRIVRINGDGSIRIILNEPLNTVKREGSEDYAGTTSVFNNNVRSNANVGYMYALQSQSANANHCVMLVNGVADKTTSTYKTKDDCIKAGGKWTTSAYEITHANVADSTVKKVVDKFYQNYIENDDSNYHYGKYLSDNIFCGDKTMADKSYGTNNTALGYAQQITYYSAFARNYDEASKDPSLIIKEAKPTLICAEGATDTFSRYTVNEYITEKNVPTNGDLTYPIGLLSADELVFAGAYSRTYNENYYLYNKNSFLYLTMSPYTYDGSKAYVLNGGIVLSSYYVGGSRGVKPVINLKSDCLATGDGTKESPYTIITN